MSATERDMAIRVNAYTGWYYAACGRCLWVSPGFHYSTGAGLAWDEHMAQAHSGRDGS